MTSADLRRSVRWPNKKPSGCILSVSCPRKRPTGVESGVPPSLTWLLAGTRPPTEATELLTVSTRISKVFVKTRRVGLEGAGFRKVGIIADQGQRRYSCPRPKLTEAINQHGARAPCTKQASFRHSRVLNLRAKRGSRQAQLAARIVHCC